MREICGPRMDHRMAEDEVLQGHRLNQRFTACTLRRIYWLSSLLLFDRAALRVQKATLCVASVTCDSVRYHTPSATIRNEGGHYRCTR